jgi:hypothetical protein
MLVMLRKVEMEELVGLVAEVVLVVMEVAAHLVFGDIIQIQLLV